MSTRESRRLGKSLAKYLEMPKITVLTIMAYAQDMLARQFFLVIIMFVFVQLWSTTYRWEGAETIGGYTMLQMLWYLAISESMSMSMPRAARDVDSDVSRARSPIRSRSPTSTRGFYILDTWATLS